MASRIKFYQVDAFTSKPFGGNPAAVCLLTEEHLPLADSVRQAIAAENNLSETAFLEILDENVTDFSQAQRLKLRWFTPTTEVPICGHATLASAAALIQGEGNSSELLSFETLSGTLTVQRADAFAPDALPTLQMTLPSMDPLHPVPGGLEQNTEFIQALTQGLPVQDMAFAGHNGADYLLIALDPATVTASQLEALQADAQAAYKITQAVRGVIVAVAPQDMQPAEVCSRFFGPWCGIDEDPVTGSAHCVLGPYYAKKLGRKALSARQCSQRSGELAMEVDFEGGRVMVSGKAVVVIEGSLLL